MLHRNHHWIVSAVVALAYASLASTASAAITPVATLTQAGMQAGSTTSVTLDLKFAPTGSDSPKDLGITLPPGLLANASLDGGACLSSTTAIPACQIGSGTVTANPIVGLPPLPPVRGPAITLPINLYLVAPPSGADLAGVLTVANPGTAPTNLGSPADVTVRSSGDPAGVGLTQRFTNLPDTFAIAGLNTPISVTELKTILTGLRLPATCPATPATLSVSADSYAVATTQTVSTPLKVTNCESLPFAPRLTASATRDATDSGTKVVTDITQKAGEAPSRSTTLVLPPTVLAPNAAAVLSDGLLCSDPTFASCKSIGTATTVSSLYPKPLTGLDYLTGSLASPAITIRFPAPFPLTLTGAVTLASGTTTFSHLPDLPLTDLKVTLTGGPAAAFAATCNPTSGTAAAALTTQNGDLGVTASASFTVANCPPGSNPGGNGSGNGNHGSTQTGSGNKAGRPTVGAGLIQGIGHGRPGLRFTATAGRGAAKLAAVTVGLPRGLSLIVHRRHGHVHISGLSLRGARIGAVSVIHGRLVVRLQGAVNRFTVVLTRAALRESSGLRRSARRHRVHRLTVGVQLRDTAHHLTKLRLTVTRIRR